jgi:hypothetical protein
MSNFTKTDAGREVTLGMQASKRIGKPEDIADVVAFFRNPDRVLGDPLSAIELRRVWAEVNSELTAAFERFTLED